MELPKRLAPTRDTIRQLFAFSGNRCASPDCPHPLIDMHGNFVAEVCHILPGDPDCEAVARRGAEEQVGAAMAARIRLSMTYMQPAFGARGIEARVHTTTLYNSIFRFDDDLLVNTHAYGAVAAKSPVMHVRRIAGGRLFSHYMESFERVWEDAEPLAMTQSDLRIVAA